MSRKSIGSKRDNLHSVVGLIGAEILNKTQHLDSNCKETYRDFVNPLLLQNPKFNLYEVEPKEPGKKTKIYVLQKPSGITNGAYLQCSACHRHAFKLYRIVKCKVAPSHLRKFGSNDNDTLRICRRCWYQGSQDDLSPKKLVEQPVFVSDTPVGVTSQRACSSWHFLRRDFVRKKMKDRLVCTKNNRETDFSLNSNRVHDLQAQMMSVVTPVLNKNNSCQYQSNKCNVFRSDGTSVCPNELQYCDVIPALPEGSKGFTFNRFSFESLVCTNADVENKVSVDKNTKSDTSLVDHDYTSLVSEVEITSQASSAICKLKNTQTRKGANKLMKQSIKKAKAVTSKPFSLNSKSLSSDSKNVHTNDISEDGPGKNDATALVPGDTGLRKRSTKLCCLCSVPILKSYGVYKIDTAPDKVKHLFTPGVTTVRACRRCIPYQKNVHRERADVKASVLKRISKVGKGLKTKNRKLKGKKGIHAFSKTNNSAANIPRKVKSLINEKSGNAGHTLSSPHCKFVQIQESSLRSKGQTWYSTVSSAIPKTASSMTVKSATKKLEGSSALDREIRFKEAGKNNYENSRGIQTALHRVSKIDNSFSSLSNKASLGFVKIGPDSPGEGIVTDTLRGTIGKTISVNILNGDLTCKEKMEEISPDGKLKLEEQFDNGKQNTGIVPNSKLCVICYQPFGKSYRRCLYEETPPKYRYVFQLYKDVDWVRICRKCLARKCWANFVTEEKV